MLSRPSEIWTVSGEVMMLFGKRKPEKPLYRHGDLLVQKITKIPGNARKVRHLVLAEGELTGHAHRVAEKESATLFELEDFSYLDVTDDHATLVHEEHGPIELPTGQYRVWRQREYTPRAIRVVRD